MNALVIYVKLFLRHPDFCCFVCFFSNRCFITRCLYPKTWRSGVLVQPPQGMSSLWHHQPARRGTISIEPDDHKKSKSVATFHLLNCASKKKTLRNTVEAYRFTLVWCITANLTWLKKHQLMQLQTSSLRTFYKAHKNVPTYLDSMSYVNFIAIDLLGIIHVTSSIKIDLSW